MTFRTLSIGGATVDLFLRVPEEHCTKTNAFLLPLGKKIEVKQIQETCGGGAANTAVGLARLGCTAAFCGMLSSDLWGQFLSGELRKEGVCTDNATIIDGETTRFSVILSNSSGERTILHEPGINGQLHRATFNQDSIRSADWIYLNHIPSESCALETDLVEILTARDSPRFTWNPGGCQIDIGLETEAHRTLAQHATLLLFNQEEATRFTKSTDALSALSLLRGTGAQNICITKGNAGVIATEGRYLYTCPSLPVNVTDTTGAGDAFGTGVTWALLQGKDLPSALHAGTLNAANVLQEIGAQRGLLTEKAMIQKLLRTPIHIERTFLPSIL